MHVHMICIHLQVANLYKACSLIWQLMQHMYNSYIVDVGAITACALISNVLNESDLAIYLAIVILYNEMCKIIRLDLNLKVICS